MFFMFVSDEVSMSTMLRMQWNFSEEVGFVSLRCQKNGPFFCEAA